MIRPALFHRGQVTVPGRGHANRLPATAVRLRCSQSWLRFYGAAGAAPRELGHSGAKSRMPGRCAKVS